MQNFKKKLKTISKKDKKWWGIFLFLTLTIVLVVSLITQKPKKPISGTLKTDYVEILVDYNIYPPVVTNGIGKSELTSTSATLNGEVVYTGDENPHVYIYWGDNDGGTDKVFPGGSWDHREDLTTLGKGTFSVDVSLDPNTTYYYRCYAENSGGGYWAGLVVRFTTPALSSESSGLDACYYFIFDTGKPNPPPRTRSCGLSSSFPVTVGVGDSSKDCSTQGENTCLVFAYSIDKAGNMSDWDLKAYNIGIENQSPVASNPQAKWNPCSHGVLIEQQVVKGGTMTFSWTYSDLDDDPQYGYEIWVDDDEDFGDTKSLNKFSYKVEKPDPGYSSYAYILNLSQDQDGVWDPDPLTDYLAPDTTYYWQVRVKDGKGGQSAWAGGWFHTPLHASPDPDFSWSPEKPTAGEVVQFCSTYKEVKTCETVEGIEYCSTEVVCPEDKSICYNSNNTPGSCSGGIFNWIMPPGSIEDVDYEFVDGTNSNFENPRIKFLTGGGEVTLEITDNSQQHYGPCSETQTVGTNLPLPKWKEITPF
jgi:hypothetical protein